MTKLPFGAKPAVLRCAPLPLLALTHNLQPRNGPDVAATRSCFARVPIVDALQLVKLL